MIDVCPGELLTLINDRGTRIGALEFSVLFFAFCSPRLFFAFSFLISLSTYFLLALVLF